MDIDDARITWVAQKIKQLRIEAGYTSYETFALDNELPRMQYWRAEKGTNLTLKTISRIANAHKLTLEEFFKGIG